MGMESTVVIALYKEQFQKVYNYVRRKAKHESEFYKVMLLLGTANIQYAQIKDSKVAILKWNKVNSSGEEVKTFNKVINHFEFEYRKIQYNIDGYDKDVEDYTGDDIIDSCIELQKNVGIYVDKPLRTGIDVFKDIKKIDEEVGDTKKTYSINIKPNCLVKDIFVKLPFVVNATKEELKTFFAKKEMLNMFYRYGNVKKCLNKSAHYVYDYTRIDYDENASDISEFMQDKILVEWHKTKIVGNTMVTTCPIYTKEDKNHQITETDIKKLKFANKKKNYKLIDIPDYKKYLAYSQDVMKDFFKEVKDITTKD